VGVEVHAIPLASFGHVCDVARTDRGWRIRDRQEEEKKMRFPYEVVDGQGQIRCRTLDGKYAIEKASWIAHMARDREPVIIKKDGRRIGSYTNVGGEVVPELSKEAWRLLTGAAR
jgi:hypothetical protein